jgi:hypothetical protein
MDHRPGLFSQPPGVLICPERIAAPKAFIASRLAAWRTPEGVILPGHWSSLLTDAADTKTACQLVLPATAEPASHCCAPVSVL